ncbi:hypothetical protein QWY93_15400 [Echinicola jeungdonensis]|uniref:Uncharacterized protein n=1 Tax=Echinicola jeungdonensis TaxID=709343 RepID=A0ABV5J358_9BACT|nr:hypothetical protein [Echinicola jeungdonensis]MDN3670709.1 hypothetical protein [Echinicola jeungdonensis]
MQKGFPQSGLLEEFDSIQNAQSAENGDTLGVDGFPSYADYSSQTSGVKESFEEYKLFSLEHRKKVFNWQYYSSIIIFVTVLLIVYSGLILSFMHFRQSLKSDLDNETELEIGKTGIKVKSSIIGIIILLISVSFLYLYLAHVYQIKEVGIGGF